MYLVYVLLIVAGTSAANHPHRRSHSIRRSKNVDEYSRSMLDSSVEETKYRPSRQYIPIHRLHKRREPEAISKRSDRYFEPEIEEYVRSYPRNNPKKYVTTDEIRPQRLREHPTNVHAKRNENKYSYTKKNNIEENDGGFTPIQSQNWYAPQKQSNYLPNNELYDTKEELISNNILYHSTPQPTTSRPKDQYSNFDVNQYLNNPFLASVMKESPSTAFLPPIELTSSPPQYLPPLQATDFFSPSPEIIKPNYQPILIPPNLEQHIHIIKDNANTFKENIQHVDEPVTIPTERVQYDIQNIPLTNNMATDFQHIPPPNKNPTQSVYLPPKFSEQTNHFYTQRFSNIIDHNFSDKEYDTMDSHEKEEIRKMSFESVKIPNNLLTTSNPIQRFYTTAIPVLTPTPVPVITPTPIQQPYVTLPVISEKPIEISKLQNLTEYLSERRYDFSPYYDVDDSVPEIVHINQYKNHNYQRRPSIQFIQREFNRDKPEYGWLSPPNRHYEEPRRPQIEARKSNDVEYAIAKDHGNYGDRVTHEQYVIEREEPGSHHINDYDEPHIKNYDETHIETYEEPHLKIYEEPRVKPLTEPRFKAFEEHRIRNPEEQQIKSFEEQHVRNAEQSRIKAFEEQRVRNSDEPRFNAFEEQNVRTSEEPRFKAFEEQNVRAAEEPRIKTFEEQHVRTAEEPRIKTFEEPRFNGFEEQHVRIAEEPRIKTFEEPRFKAFEEQRSKAFDDQHIKIYEEPQIKSHKEPPAKTYEEPYTESHIKSSEEPRANSNNQGLSQTTTVSYETSVPYTAKHVVESTTPVPTVSHTQSYFKETHSTSSPNNLLVTITQKYEHTSQNPIKYPQQFAIPPNHKPYVEYVSTTTPKTIQKENQRDFTKALKMYVDKQKSKQPPVEKKIRLPKEYPLEIQPRSGSGNRINQDEIVSSFGNQYIENQHDLFVQPYNYSYNKPTTETVPVLRETKEMALDGSFHYETLIGDQTHVIQEGHIENPGTDDEEQVIHGSYSFLGDDGKTYTVNYVADSNGFRAAGDHLPTPPPIPEIIQRSIEKNRAEAEKNPQILLDGSYTHGGNYLEVGEIRDRSSKEKPIYVRDESKLVDTKGTENSKRNQLPSLRHVIQPRKDNGHLTDLYNTKDHIVNENYGNEKVNNYSPPAEKRSDIGVFDELYVDKNDVISSLNGNINMAIQNENAKQWNNDNTNYETNYNYNQDDNQEINIDFNNAKSVNNAMQQILPADNVYTNNNQMHYSAYENVGFKQNNNPNNNYRSYDSNEQNYEHIRNLEINKTL